MASREQSIEIFAPVLGIKTNVPSSIMEPRSQPDGQDFRLLFGDNRKEYGTTIYCTGNTPTVGAPVNFMFNAQFSDLNVLQVFNATGVYRYAANIDSVTNDGQAFTGTYTDYWSGLLYNDAFIYTNGVDPIQYKASASATGTNMASALSPTTYKAWAVQALNEHLCLYHTIENGTEFVKRVRWARKGTLTYSAGTTDFGSGTAGAIDLPDAQGQLRAAAPISGGIAVYADRSIHLQTWVGGAEIYTFDKKISGVGTPSRRGAIDVRGINYFVSDHSVHEYTGSDYVTDIGETIRDKMFSEINPSNVSDIYLSYDDANDEVNVHIPTDDEYVDVVYVYSRKNRSWARLVRPYTAVAYFSRQTGLTIGELPGTIGDLNFTIGSTLLQAEARLRVFADTAGYLVKEDPTVNYLTISGTITPQNYVYYTPVLTAANATDPIDKDKVDYTHNNKRWTQVELEVAGAGTADIAYSTNRGQTFTLLAESPISLSPSFSSFTLAVYKPGRDMQYRVTCSGTNDTIALRYFKADFIPQGRN